MVCMTILPLTYLGNVEYYSYLLAGDCIIDTGENYVKQTFRNRCEILSPNGVFPLTVNVVKGGSRDKKPVRDMRVDYSKRWQHQHAHALVSAYRNSPYFEHYWQRFAPFYEKHYEFLADFNLGLTAVLLDILGQPGGPAVSERFIEASPEDTDLRKYFNGKDSRPSIPGRAPGNGSHRTLRFAEYYQVFGDRHPFAENLSVIDAVFCEGPYASAIVAQTKP